MSVKTEYQFLESRPGSNYRQLFVKGRKIRAEILYHMTVDSEPRTPEEVARDFRLPVEAVREAIEYSIRNQKLLREERERGWKKIRARQSAAPDEGPSPKNEKA
jgi:uncharacterized protein (DUF433 family)